MSSVLDYTCPNCRNTLRARLDHAGRPARCPRCQSPHRIPAAAGAPVGVPPPASDPALVRCPGCAAKLRIAAALVGKRVLCPRCKQEVHPGRQPTPPAPPAAAPPPLAPSPPRPASAPPGPPAEEDPLLQEFRNDWSRYGPGWLAAVRVLKRGTPTRHRIAGSWASFFRRQLGPVLLGRPLTAGVYGENVLRFAGLPAGAGSTRLQAAVVRLTGPAQRPANPLRLGYDHLLPPGDRGAMPPSVRGSGPLLAELFWPHVAEGTFRALADAGTLFVPRVIELLAERAGARNAAERDRARHALAVILHNLAIAGECAHADGLAPAPDDCWRAALAFWRQVWEGDSFWRYLVDCWPSMRPPGWERRLRDELPAVAVSFNRLFADAYARAGDEVGCYRHLSLIESSGLGSDLGDSLRAVVLAAYE